MITDIPLLVFGGKDVDNTNFKYSNPFTQVFSIDTNLTCRKKCGEVPLIRFLSLFDMMLHQVVVKVDSTVNVGTDSKAKILLYLEL